MNIQPNDLKIGSQYHSVKWNLPVRFTAEDMIELVHRADGAYVDAEVIAEMFDPIPLTEEWFEKLGFEFFQGCWTNDNCDFELVMEEPNSYSILVNGRLSFAPSVQYVHQLQSLYHALTGDMLYVKRQ